MAAGQRMVAVLDEDAALEGIAREHLAEVYVSESPKQSRRIAATGAPTYLAGI